MDVLKICNIKITAEPENVNSIAQAFRAVFYHLKDD